MGALSGVVTGATGVFVMPAVPYLQSLGLQRDELVQALGLAFTVSTISLTAGLVLHGAFGIQQLGLSALAVLPALLGMWLGQLIRQRISARVFRLLPGVPAAARAGAGATAVVLMPDSGHEKTRFRGFFSFSTWCPGEDSNLHGFTR